MTARPRYTETRVRFGPVPPNAYRDLIAHRLTPDRLGEPLKRPNLPLPEGLIDREGVVMFECAACGEWTELPVAPAEYEHGHPHNVCGRSPRCCP